mgnify:CR=1 FL=1
MLKKKIFNQKKNYFNIKNIFISLILVLVIFSFKIFFFSNNNKIFLIPEYKNSYYIIPKNKQGLEVLNLNKKGMHLSYKDDDGIEIFNNINLLFSIQLMTNSNFDLINNYKNDLLNSNNKIFKHENLFITIFESSIGKEYFLLHMNFTTRLKALEYCNNFSEVFNNCIVLNFKNFN